MDTTRTCSSVEDNVGRAWIVVFPDQGEDHYSLTTRGDTDRGEQHVLLLNRDIPLMRYAGFKGHIAPVRLHHKVGNADTGNITRSLYHRVDSTPDQVIREDNLVHAVVVAAQTLKLLMERCTERPETRFLTCRGRLTIDFTVQNNSSQGQVRSAVERIRIGQSP